MSYQKEFEQQIGKKDFNKILTLWEEYCTNDVVEKEEFLAILDALEKSEMALKFGKYIEMALPLWQTIKDEEASYEVMKKMIDLQTTNSPLLADTALAVLEKKYQSDPLFAERIRLIGLRSKNNFQGSLSNYDLLWHMAPGKCVFHAGGWGTGEIMEVSPLREQLSVEFENVSGKKHITFDNAFKTLKPLPDEHFLARRFINPNKIEKEAKEDPVEIIKVLLRDLGPKTASEIKDELSELVIPENEWSKWWQAARGKLKKNTMIESPSKLKDPFILRTKEVTHQEKFNKDIESHQEIQKLIQTSYNYVRDFPNTLKNEDVKAPLVQKLHDLLGEKDLTLSEKLQLSILLEDIVGNELSKEFSVKTFVADNPTISRIIEEIEIAAFKKRALSAIREYRNDWQELFLNFFFTIQQAQLRDYILKEITASDARKLFEQKILELLENPTKDPETFIWYFQKIMADGESSSYPFNDKEGQMKLLESFLILLHRIESMPVWKDLTKKMILIISGKRYAVIRKILEGTPLEFVKEFLLLSSKCHSFTDHDIKILKSLAHVVHPSLSPHKKKKDRVLLDGRIIWTTESGFNKTRDRLERIGTVEIVENSREVEAARALGDLRENSEYKFAVEKRRHLQGELKRLGEQLNRARIISPLDVENDEVGIGNVVEVENPKGERLSYTILGPWDADPDDNIVSFQSKLAQAMCGKLPDEKFSFKDEDWKIISISSYLDKKAR